MELAKIFQVMQTTEMWATPFLTGLGVERPVALLLGSPTNWVKVSQRLRSLSIHWNHLAGEWREGFKNYWCVFLIPRDSDGADLGYGLGVGVCKRSLGDPNGRCIGNSCPEQILVSPLSFLICNMGALSVYKTGAALPSTFLKMQANSFKGMIEHFLPERDCWTV